MQAKLLVLSLLLFAFLSLNMTCNQSGQQSTDQSSASTCIDKSKINPNKGCPRILAPVCGCDGVTYNNSCEADKKGVTDWVDGKCNNTSEDTDCIDEAKINPEGLCMQVYQPVCGCDGQTYGNSCEADRAGVTKWVEGACDTNQKGDCIDPSKIATGDCPDEYAPVCGCNEVTYSNVCKAKLAGVTSWTNGKCK